MVRSAIPNQWPTPERMPFTSATSPTKANTIAPTITASLTPSCAPCAAAMMTLAGLSSSSPWLVSIISLIGRLARSGSSGIINLAIRIAPGADMKLAASRYSIRIPIEA